MHHATSTAEIPTTAPPRQTCAACARPLADAESARLGIGPTCLARHIDDVVAPAAYRTRALAIMHRLSLGHTGQMVIVACDELRSLGYAELADKILRRAVKVTIELDGDDGYLVRCPYSDDQVDRFRSLPGRRWDGERKAWRIPRRSRHALWQVIQDLFRGSLAAGPDRVFLI